MEVTSRIQPNTIEEACLQTAQHVGNGHNIHNPAELQQHNELRHCWLPGQNNSLPFLIKNKTTRKHTHTRHTTTTDSSCGHSQISTSQLVQIFSIFKAKLQHLGTISSRHFCKYWLHNLRCFASPDFAASNSMQLQATFGYVGGISTLYANKSNFRQILVMMVGSPLFMQTISTSNFMHWLPWLYCLSLHHLIVIADLSLTFLTATETEERLE
jgi:hypothetical protein